MMVDKATEMARDLLEVVREEYGKAKAVLDAPPLPPQQQQYPQQGYPQQGYPQQGYPQQGYQQQYPGYTVRPSTPSTCYLR